MMERIKIPQTGLEPKEILLEDRGQEIILFDSALLFTSSGKWDLSKEGDDLIREKKYFDNTVLLDRNDFLPMEMYYHNESRRYILEIGKISIAFGNISEHPTHARERCKTLFDKITKWKYGIEL
jgi:hypothetical protein